MRIKRGTVQRRSPRQIPYRKDRRHGWLELCPTSNSNHSKAGQTQGSRCLRVRGAVRADTRPARRGELGVRSLPRRRGPRYSCWYRTLSPAAGPHIPLPHVRQVQPVPHVTRSPRSGVRRGLIVSDGQGPPENIEGPVPDSHAVSRGFYFSAAGNSRGSMDRTGQTQMSEPPDSVDDANRRCAVG